MENTSANDDPVRAGDDDKAPRIKRAVKAWAWVLVLAIVGVVVRSATGGFTEATMRTVFWLPVGIGVGIWALCGAQVARWILGLGALVVFALSVLGAVSHLRSLGGESGAVSPLLLCGLALLTAGCAFNVIRLLFWSPKSNQGNKP